MEVTSQRTNLHNLDVGWNVNKLPHIIACFELVKNNNAMVCDSGLGYNLLIKASTLCTSLYVDVTDSNTVYLYTPKMLCCIILLITVFSSEGFSVGSQSSVAGYSQLPFPAASQTHLTSGTEGRHESLYQNSYK